MICVPSERLRSACSTPSLFRVFAVRIRKPCVFVNPLSPPQRHWSGLVEYACHCVDFGMVSLNLLACLKDWRPDEMILCYHLEIMCTVLSLWCVHVYRLVSGEKNAYHIFPQPEIEPVPLDSKYCILPRCYKSQLVPQASTSTSVLCTYTRWDSPPFPPPPPHHHTHTNPPSKL